jgi:hypothetical protein
MYVIPPSNASCSVPLRYTYVPDFLDSTSAVIPEGLVPYNTKVPSRPRLDAIAEKCEALDSRNGESSPTIHYAVCDMPEIAEAKKFEYPNYAVQPYDIFEALVSTL